MTDVERLLERGFGSIAECEEDAKKAFGAVRILMVGKSGSGKSTLVRCMGFHDDAGAAPEPSHEGQPGVQDIRKVWKHPTFPLHIHDSDGIEFRKKDRLSVIQTFLDTEKQKDFFQRVHLIWYLIPVYDTRIMDDGQLMEILGSYRGVFHLQLIVTNMDQDNHKDADGRGRKYRKNIEANLDKFLAAVDGKEEVKSNIIHVGNVSSGKEGEEFSEEEFAEQQEALRKLSERTVARLDEKQKLTWVSAQVVDVSAKLRATANVIVLGQFRNTVKYILAFLTAGKADMQDKLLKSRRDQICKIWNVPTPLSDTLWGTEEVTSICISFLHIVFPKDDSWFSWMENKVAGTKFSRVVLSYTMISAALILSVRRKLPGTWHDQTKQQYEDMCKTFPIQEFKESLTTLGIWNYLTEGLADGKSANKESVQELLTNFVFFREPGGGSYVDLYNPKAGRNYNDTYHSEETALESPEVRELAEHHRVCVTEVASYLKSGLTLAGALVEAGAAVIGIAGTVVQLAAALGAL